MASMFEIRGKLGKGYVAAELVLDGGKPKYNTLTVTHAKDQQRLLLEGEATPPFQVLYMCMPVMGLRNTCYF
jgi:hypothetical protein